MFWKGDYLYSLYKGIDVLKFVFVTALHDCINIMSHVLFCEVGHSVKRLYKYNVLSCEVKALKRYYIQASTNRNRIKRKTNRTI